MHVQNLNIYDIRSIERLEMDIPEPRAGWHVILGDNGSGKSSVVRALAFALVGLADAAATRQNWLDWVRRSSDVGQVTVELGHDTQFDKWTKTGGQSKRPLKLDIQIHRKGKNAANKVGGLILSAPNTNAERTIWGGATGWFSASFGPFRRFSGGDREYDRLFSSNPRLAPHLSAFGEDVALGEALRWLQDLQFKLYEGDQVSTRLLKGLLDFIQGSELLPHGANVDEITSDTVMFEDGTGTRVPVEQLSDGFRSVLSMTFELLRGMVAAYGHETFLSALDAEATAIRLPGVVAIDEIDAHLHPAWQRRIGDWLTQRFPLVQFFVTTHSPIIGRSAANGTIWRLPTPAATKSPTKSKAKIAIASCTEASSMPWTPNTSVRTSPVRTIPARC